MQIAKKGDLLSPPPPACTLKATPLHIPPLIAPRVSRRPISALPYTLSPSLMHADGPLGIQEGGSAAIQRRSGAERFAKGCFRRWQNNSQTKEAFSINHGQIDECCSLFTEDCICSSHPSSGSTYIHSSGAICMQANLSPIPPPSRKNPWRRVEKERGSLPASNRSRD